MLLPCPICTAPTPKELVAAGVALRNGDLATAESILARADLAAAALAADAAGRPDATDAALGALAAIDTGRRTDLDAVVAAPGHQRAECEAEQADDDEPPMSEFVDVTAVRVLGGGYELELTWADGLVTT